jgi:hypothetical protein
MSFKLEGHYPPGERAVFATLARGMRLSTKDIAKRVWKNGDTPRHADKIIIGRMRSLGVSLGLHGAKFKLCRTERRGPHPIEFWLEAR